MGRAIDKTKPEHNWEVNNSNNNNNSNADSKNTFQLSFDAPESVGDFVLWTRIKRDLCCSTIVVAMLLLLLLFAGLIKSKIRLSIEQKRSMSRPALALFVVLWAWPKSGHQSAIKIA